MTETQTAIRRRNQLIEGTNIFVYNTSSDGRVVFSMPFTAQEASYLVEDANKSMRDNYPNADGLKQGLKANPSGELVNMSTLKGIVANRVLMQNTQGRDFQKWLPTIQEAIRLGNAGLLPSGYLFDAGLVLYNAKEPDIEVAKALVAEAQTAGYTLPVLASFKSLGLKTLGTRYGVTPKLVSADGLVYGEEAQNLLADNNFIIGNSGVRRLDRDGGGPWCAYWLDDLDDFYEYCRVGRFSAVGSAKNLMNLVNIQLDQNFTAKRRNLESEAQRLASEEKTYRQAAESVLS